MRTRESSRRDARVSSGDLRRAFREAPVAMTLATGFGAGLSPFAPGTAGSVVGLLLAAGVAALLAPAHGTSFAPAVGLLTSGLLVAAAGVPIATRACRAVNAKDPGCVVVDEVAGQLLALSPAPLFVYPARNAAAAVWIVAFVGFRFFDVVKPGPIRRLQELPEGWGVVVDDVLAGLLAAGVTAAAGWLLAGERLWT